jgi:hypothetical protein
MHNAKERPSTTHHTPAQQAHSAINLDKIHSSGNDNTVPSPLLVDSELAKVLHCIKLEKKRGDDYKRRNNNEHCKQLRSKAAIKNLKAKAAEQSMEVAKVKTQLELVTHDCNALADNKAILEGKNTVLKKQKDVLWKGKEHAIAAKATTIEKAKKSQVEGEGGDFRIFVRHHTQVD